MKKTTGKTKIGKYKVYYYNHPELSGIKREIFSEQIYHFESDGPQPIIIDVGAHIGLATLYFKSIYPEAKVTCFEPVPENFKLLEQNVYENGLFNVECVNGAITPQNLTRDETKNKITLHIDPSPKDKWYSSASIHPQAWNGQQPTQPIQVKAYSLLPWLNKPIDLLKMDIEGAEWQILPNIKSKLHLIKQLIIECHPTKKQTTNSLASLLNQANYKTEVIPRKFGLDLLKAIKI